MSVFSTSKIAKFFENRLEFLTRGEDHINSNYITVRKMVKGSNNITGHVEPGRGSTKNKSKLPYYIVEITFSESEIESGYCTCPIGKLKCSHMAALLLWPHKMYSKTDFPVEWNRPTSKTSPLEKEIKQIWPPKLLSTGLHSPMNQGDIEFLRNRVDPVKQFGLYFLIQPKNVTVQAGFAVSIDKLIHERADLTSDEKIEHILGRLKLTSSQQEEITRLTVGQASSELWLQLRRGRITASYFGMVLKQIKLGRFPPSFWKQLFGGYNLARVQSVLWGKSHEKDGIRQFETISGRKVIPAGIMLTNEGFLGASPDGLVVDENALVEIKCSWKHRDTSLMTALSDKSFCLDLVDDQCVLKSNHAYYDQVQGLLTIWQNHYCYFCVWTPNWFITTVVDKDETWRGNMERMKGFYSKVYLKKLIDGSK